MCIHDGMFWEHCWVSCTFRACTLWQEWLSTPLIPYRFSMNLRPLFVVTIDHLTLIVCFLLHISARWSCYTISRFNPEKSSFFSYLTLTSRTVRGCRSRQSTEFIAISPAEETLNRYIVFLWMLSSSELLLSISFSANIATS